MTDPHAPCMAVVGDLDRTITALRSRVAELEEAGGHLAEQLEAAIKSVGHTLSDDDSLTAWSALTAREETSDE